MVKRFLIASGTVAALMAGGWGISVWDEHRGQAIVNGDQDTVWFIDSSELEKFARYGRATFGDSRYMPTEGDNIVILMRSRMPLDPPGR